MTRKRKSRRSNRNGSRQYETLPYDFLGPDMIRLIIVESGKAEDELIIKVITVPRTGSSGTYKALSYTWGGTMDAVNVAYVNPVQTFRQLISGNIFTTEGQKCYRVPITRNLKQALLALREENTPVVLWVDQICINQNDLKEKAQQIQLMRDIYSGAKTVLVWLSQEIYQARTMTEHLLAVGLILSECTPPFDNTRPTTSMGFPVVLKTEVKMTAAVISKFEALSDKVWQSIILLFSCAYWRRVWIIQEIAVAKEVKIVLAHGSCLLSLIQVIAGYIGHIRFPQHVRSSPIRRNTKSLQSLCEIKTRFDCEPSVYNQGRLDLMELVVDTRASEATDPRDRVYALLGLLQYDKYYLPSRIEPDYTISFPEVFSTVFAEAIVDRSDLTFLPFCNFHIGASMPSWTVNTDATEMIRSELTAYREQYHAHGSTIPSVSHASRPTALRFKVRKLGRVMKVSKHECITQETRRSESVYPFTNYGGSEKMKQVAHHMNEWRELAFSRGPNRMKVRTPGDRPTILVGYPQLRFLGRQTLCDLSIDGKSVASDEEITKVFQVLNSVAAWPSLMDEEQGNREFLIACMKRTCDMHLCTFDLECDHRVDLGWAIRQRDKIIAQPFTSSEDITLDDLLEPRLGWVPPGVEIDDEVCIVHGFSMPMIIRKTGQDEYRFLGCSYVMDFMQGEAFDNSTFADEVITVV